MAFFESTVHSPRERKTREPNVSEGAKTLAMSLANPLSLHHCKYPSLEAMLI